ncbi:MAG: glycosyltransferase [Candidatus Lokiarchaeota archaeon]|nr:glycosyltransferase [Candidatus Lokiarchaeota archaeon]
MNNHHKVTVVVACRNEEKYIGNCLESIIANDYPKEHLEVLVVDGMSTDKTRDIIDTYAQNFSFIERVDNPKFITPSAFNLGIKNASGDVVMIMGSHSKYESDYISNCVKYLNEYDADNVGGILKTLPGDKTNVAKAIAESLSHPFGVGNSSFRVGSQKPIWADTVFGGCYKKKVFDEVGLFNENLVRSQDMDFNIRLKSSGGKILLVPSIVAEYFAKPTLKSFFLHNFKDGFWAVFPLKFGSAMFKFRHLLPLFFVASVLVGLLVSFLWTPFKIMFISGISAYFLLSLFSSATLAWRYKNVPFFIILPFVFGARHFGYGLGSLWGLWKLAVTARQPKLAADPN